MKPRFLFTIFVVLLGGFLIYQKTPSGSLENFFLNQQQEEPNVESGETEADKAAGKENLTDKELPSLPKAPETKTVKPKGEVSAPGPLEVPSPSPATSPSPPPAGGPSLPLPPPSPIGLTQSGIILQTNLQRQENGSGFLAENIALNAAAVHKANGMCEKQYFAHVSPSGVGAGDLAQNFGYDYLSIGENLALGPFANDAAVVLAWMGSPGHRANILNSKFTEIGVGAVKCVFEGRSTWLAVQHFGKPASDCHEPSVSLRQAIDEKKSELAELKDKLVILRAEIEATHPADPQYNDKVNSYNSLAKQYNDLIAETKNLINEYNSQVTVFNTCASG